VIFRRFAPLVAAGLVLAGLTVVTAPSASALGPVFGSYEPTGPTRVLDTRTGAYGNRHGAVGPGGKVRVTVTGASGVPSNAEAVALTITVVSATRPGSITASTDGLGSPPGATNVQFHPGRTATDLALVKPTNGKIDLWNESAGRVQLVADVLGYYVGGGTPTFDGTLRTLPPKRVVRFAHGRIAPHTALTVKLHSAAGLPRSAGAVAATVTVVGPGRAGSLVDYATNTTRPAAPLMDFPAARQVSTSPDSVSQFGILPVSDIQQLSLFNRSKGSLHVLVDVVGWFPAGPAAVVQSEQVVAANRIFADNVVPAHGSDAVGVLGRGGVPKTGVSAVVVSARVAAPARAGALVGGSGAGPIVASFGPGRPATGQAILTVHNGSVRLRNASNGRLALEVDVVGYIVSNGIAPPTSSSVARYPNDLTQNISHDNTVMTTHGNDDGDSGGGFVLLDFGAQSIHGPQLTATHPGVAITLTDPVVRLRYPQLTTVLNHYLAGLGAHSGGRSITVAVGTNNDGDWAHYRATPRGRDWANLVDGLTAPANITVIGANDIESNFASTEAQAQSWEDAYFAHTAANLVFNGSLNDCPTVFGDTSPCAFGWTQKQFWRLAHHVEHGHNRTRVLPQIYFPVQAVQWANVFAHGGGGLRFVGSLTQFQADSRTFRPGQGWAALYRALQWKVATPNLPFAVDIGPAS
jgi:hypothetical protein